MAEALRTIDFNQRSPGLRILNGVEDYTDEYVYPKHIMEYLEDFIPNEKDRDYLVRFVKTKLTTLEHSPVILGLSGSDDIGKDLFIQILKDITREYMPDYIDIPDKYNFWIKNRLFIALDFNLDRRIIATLKTYSDSGIVRLKEYGKDYVLYNHTITFIATKNVKKLALAMGAERVRNIRTRNTYMCTHDTVHNVRNEVLSFCRYLRNYVEPLSSNEYMNSGNNLLSCLGLKS